MFETTDHADCKGASNRAEARFPLLCFLPSSCHNLQTVGEDEIHVRIRLSDGAESQAVRLTFGIKPLAIQVLQVICLCVLRM